MRVVGLDVSRAFAEIAYVEDGQLRPGGRVALLVAELTQWAATTLRPTDHVVLEATGNTTAVVVPSGPTSGGWWWPIRRRCASSLMPG